MNRPPASAEPAEYRVGRMWHFAAWLTTLLGLFLGIEALVGEHPSPGSALMSIIAGATLLLLGITFVYICHSYVIRVAESAVSCCMGMLGCKLYPLRGVRDVRISGVYLILDYGSVPRPTVLVLCNNRMALFHHIAELAHSLPRGFFADRGIKS